MGSGLHEYYDNLTKQPRCYNRPVNGELSSFDGLRIAMLAVLRGIEHSARICGLDGMNATLNLGQWSPSHQHVTSARDAITWKGSDLRG